MKAKTASATQRQDKSQKKSKAQKPSKRPAFLFGPARYFAAALVAVVFVAYTNSLGNDFVFDDNHLVLRSRRWLSFANIIELAASYRPVRNFSYAIDFAIWGERPFGFHLTNVLIHAAAAVLVFLLIKRLTERPLPAFLTALIFAVHPIQTDAVAYVSGRRDVLFGLFYVAAFLSYLAYRSRNSRRYFVLFLVLGALSLMSKEMAVSLPLVIFLWNFCGACGETPGSRLKQTRVAIGKAFSKDKWLYLALSMGGAAYVSYMIFVQQSSGRVGSSGVHYWGDSFWANMLTVFRVHGWYLKQLIWPTPIAQYYGAFDISHSLADWRVLLSLVTVGALVAAAFALLDRHKLMAFAILSYFAMLLPVSQIIPHHELVADHYLYLPIMSFGLLVSLLIERLAARRAEHRKLAYVAAGLIVILFGSLTVRRNQDWKNELTLWQANYEAVPNSPRAAHNLGGMYLKSNPQRAEELFKQALAADSNFEPAYLALAKLYVTQKRIPEAEDMVGRGLAIADADAGSRILRNLPLLRSQLTTVLAAAKWEAGAPEQTEKLLWDAVNLFQGNAEAYDSLANLYHAKDRSREVDVLKRAVLNGAPYEMLARLTSVLIEEKRYDEARVYLQRMLGLTASRSDCSKAGAYLASARAAVGRAMELREMDEMLRALIERCTQ